MAVVLRAICNISIHHLCYPPELFKPRKLIQPVQIHVVLGSWVGFRESGVSPVRILSPFDYKEAYHKVLSAFNKESTE